MKYSTSNDSKFIISPILTKFTFLYQIINKNCIKIGSHNVFHIIGMIMIIYTTIFMFFGLFGLYYWVNDSTQFTMYLVMVVSFSFGCFKLYIIIIRWKEIQECMEITRIDFVSSDSKSIDYLQTHRILSSKFIYWFIIVNYCVLLSWTIFPLLIKGVYIEVKNLDGSYSKYRFNTCNIYFLVSSETYNDYFHVFNFIELLIGFFFLLSMVLFDTFMVTMSITIIGQLQVIANAYRNLGWKIININGKSQLEKSKDHFQELKLLIKKQQEVLSKVNNFYNVVRPVILPQLIVPSSTIIILCYVVTLNYFNDALLTQAQSLKFFSFPTFLCQLYYTCLVFGKVNDQIDYLNFALYSCNWTMMDIEFKKLLLSTMQINESNKLNMKLTAHVLVNLELFNVVIRTCYSIFSVLVKSHLKKNL